MGVGFAGQVSSCRFARGRIDSSSLAEESVGLCSCIDVSIGVLLNAYGEE